MCLIAFDYRPGQPAPLRLVANRDEFHARPSAALAVWPDAPSIVGGRDLQAGGTWLAVHRRGRFAAVTNVRDPELIAPSGAPSRGHLVREALECNDLAAWLEALADRHAADYAGFNLLAGGPHGLWHLHRGRQRIQLLPIAPGIHGISNDNLNTPWPKLELARRGLAQSLESGNWPQAALAAMRESRPVEELERLPDTGVGAELEKRLSPPFIVGDDYGTRAMSWLEWRSDGHIEIGERRFGPNGEALGETQLEVECG
ncbi:NRDE family protein [Litchfieldella rifensis]|uniref:NRDE family protein n=1 Tax=Litchfieldella rifensis TaxID=762643 RepID=A0ABV7LR16_9GAMM